MIVFEMNEEKLSESGYDITPISPEVRSRLAEGLNDEERRIMLDHGTEPAFCGTLLDNKEEGLAACRLCGLPLFTSKYKFNSGTGGPPFTLRLTLNICVSSTGKIWHIRIEIRYARCDSHQGHVFPDGPRLQDSGIVSIQLR